MALLAAYAFDDIGGSTVVDLSGNGHDITLTGTAGAQVSGGQTGGALGKTGATMPVLPAGLTAAAQSDDRSLMWDGLNNFGTWWIRFERDAINSGTWGGLNLSGAMTFFARNTSDTQMSGRPTAALPGTTAFVNYCVTYSRASGVATLYRGGVSVGTASFPAGTQLSTAADRINIAEWTDTGPSLDNLRIYNHALTGAEVAALAGTPVTAAARSGSAPLTTAVDMTATGVRTSSGSVSLAGTADVVASGVKTAGAVVPLLAAVALPAGGSKTVAGAGPLDAIGDLAAGGVKTAAGEGGLTVGADLTTAGGRVSLGLASLLTAVTLTPAGVAVRAGAAGLAATVGVDAHRVAETAPAPPERTFTVAAESRVLSVLPESRVVEA